jgi:hypothetical protein
MSTTAHTPTPATAPPARPVEPASHKVLRAAAGALWSLPLRFVTIPAIVGSMVLAAGGPVGFEDLRAWHVALAGAVTSVVLRFFDNLAVEFAVFPALLHFLKGRL